MPLRALGKADWQILLAGLQKHRGCVEDCIYEQERWTFMAFLLMQFMGVLILKSIAINFDMKVD